VKDGILFLELEFGCQLKCVVFILEGMILKHERSNFDWYAAYGEEFGVICFSSEKENNSS